MKRGFTLIELLAVIVILTIVALIAIPIIFSIIEKTKKQSAKASTLGYINAIIILTFLLKQLVLILHKIKAFNNH